MIEINSQIYFMKSHKRSTNSRCARSQYKYQFFNQFKTCSKKHTFNIIVLTEDILKKCIFITLILEHSHFFSADEVKKLSFVYYHNE